MDRYVEFEKIAGVLKISLTDAGREWLDEDEFEYPDLDELIEPQLANGWEFIGPEEIGALTDAPILSDEVVRDAKGELTGVGWVYWYPEYETRNPVEELDRKGYVLFEAIE